jgi:hypothetical protein
MHGADTRCRIKYGPDDRQLDMAVFAACVDADVKQHCPEFSGESGWFAWWRNNYWWDERKR